MELLRCNQVFIRQFNTTQLGLLAQSQDTLRTNPVGVQRLTETIHNQLFPGARDTNPTFNEKRLIELSKKHLKDNDLLGKKCSISAPINFRLPKLQGNTIEEHFQRIGSLSCEDYLPMIDTLLRVGNAPPKMPANWQFKSGWTRYAPGQVPQHVQYPLEDELVFDVETLYKLTHYPCLATCMSPKAWYGWVSPFLTGESDQIDGHLIPLGVDKHKKIIVGHNVSYDRARCQEEYSLEGTKAFYLDTMSLHIAVSGMCSQQRSVWMKYRRQKEEAKENSDLDEIKESITTDELKHLLDNPALKNDSSDPLLKDNPWLSLSTINSLAEVAKFHCGIKMNKQIRDDFETLEPDLIRQGFQKFMTYCANDVISTYQVFRKVYPMFRKLVPHNVSLAGIRHISQSYLPITHEWTDYITRSEAQYQESFHKIEEKLLQLCEEAAELRKYTDTRPWENDPWLSQLDWTIQPIKYTKSGVPYKRQKLPGYPEWYKKLVTKGKIELTIKTRIAPLLLRLSWEGRPIYWTNTYGWCFQVEREDEPKFERKYIRADEELLKENGEESTVEKALFRIPHEMGPQNRTTSLMSKPFMRYFEKDTLSSQFKLAKEALALAVSNSYWQSSRERIMDQFVVFNSDKCTDMHSNDPDMGVIIPQVVTMGTITRRAVEKTWLTASNAKENRLGSELKAMVRAPKGYCFVGADVDSEELWIASLMGDSVFKMHGGTALGWMTLEGDKSQGTDLHSKTAKILGISRGEAKVFNYGRIYGAGVTFATTLLNKFNPNLTEQEAIQTARKLYASTKGKSNVLEGTRIWYGGSESVVFNRLEQISHEDSPRTPALGAGITAALKKRNLNRNTFLPSRMNWTIQSSGVDYLHLIMSSVEYLCQVYKVPARLCMTVHDEVRYLCSIEDKYKLGMIMQIANLWTRAMFCHQVGLEDLPQGCAFFSAVDFDHVIRKEVDMDCITPTSQKPIEHGESLDIYQLLDKPEVQQMLSSPRDMDLRRIAVKKPVQPVQELDKKMDAGTKSLYVALQIATTEKEFKSFKSKYLRNLDIQKRYGRNYRDPMDDVELTKPLKSRA